MIRHDSTLSRETGGHLASVGDNEIQEFLAEKKTGIWIRAYESEREGNWKWSDCSPWNWTKWSPSWGGQPNNYGGRENCAMINWAYLDKGQMYPGWHDVRCSRNVSFVCSKKVVEDCEDVATISTENKDTGNPCHLIKQYIHT